jgi:hypothetical protein
LKSTIPNLQIYLPKKANSEKLGLGIDHGLPDWQAGISVLSSPLTDKWRHFLQEQRHFPSDCERAGSFVREIPRSLDDAADQQHAHSLPFRYFVGLTIHAGYFL